MNALPAGTIFVVLRRARIQPARGSTEIRWRMPCCINPGAHKHGDRHASGYADGPRNLVGCSVCGALSAKRAAEYFGVDWGEVLDEVNSGRAPTSAAAPRLPARQSPTPPPPSRPGGRHALWAGCTSVCDDLPTRRALAARAIDPALVAERDLARVLPGNVPLPSWARFGNRTWADLGHRLVVPMYAAAGELATLHARRLGDGDTPKGLSPKDHSHAGTVFADALGRLLLSAGPPAWWRNNTVLISEGVPDFLTLATHYADAEDVPAVFGVICGSWSPAIAARIPSGAQVVIRTHLDAAGERFAHVIAETLVARCKLFRPAPPSQESSR